MSALLETEVRDGFMQAGLPKMLCCKRVPYTFYVKRDGAIYFLVNRDLNFFLFVIRD